MKLSLLDDMVEDGPFGAALPVRFPFVSGHAAQASATAMPAGECWIIQRSRRLDPGERHRLRWRRQALAMAGIVRSVMREELANHQNPAREVLTAEHVAEMLEVHVRTVAKLVVRDRLPARRLGHEYRFDRAEYWRGSKNGRRAPVRNSSGAVQTRGESEELEMGVFARRRRAGTVYYV